jgi:biotin carboxyl carrier protein
MRTVLHLDGTVYTVEYTQNGQEYQCVVNGQPLTVRLLGVRNNALILHIEGRPVRAYLVHDGSRVLVAVEGQVYEMTPQERQVRTREGDVGRFDPEVRSPMPGKILAVLVTAGAEVDIGQPLLLLEAMKMENTLTAGSAARIRKIHVSPGDLVDLGQLLIELDVVAPTAA